MDKDLNELGIIYKDLISSLEEDLEEKKGGKKVLEIALLTNKLKIMELRDKYIDLLDENNQQFVTVIAEKPDALNIVIKLMFENKVYKEIIKDLGGLI